MLQFHSSNVIIDRTWLPYDLNPQPASLATKPLLPLDLVMALLYQKAAFPNGVSIKMYGFFNDVERKEHFLYSSD